MTEETEYEYLTVAEALQRLKRRDFKGICAHIQVHAYTDPDHHFSPGTYIRLTRKEAAEFIKKVIYGRLEERGARVRVQLYDNHTLWLF